MSRVLVTLVAVAMVSLLNAGCKRALSKKYYVDATEKMRACSTVTETKAELVKKRDAFDARRKAESMKLGERRIVQITLDEQTALNILQTCY